MRKLILAAAFAMAFPTSAFADDYIFNVPVRIENAPGIYEAHISCGVTLRSATGVETYVPGRATLTIPPTGYRGTVQIRATVPVGARREDQINWSCAMTLLHRDAAGTVSAMRGDPGAWYEDVSGRRVVSHHLSEFAYLSRP